MVVICQRFASSVYIWWDFEDGRYSSFMSSAVVGCLIIPNANNCVTETSWLDVARASSAATIATSASAGRAARTTNSWTVGSFTVFEVHNVCTDISL